MIEQRHQQHIGGALAHQGKEDRLSPLACGLEHRNGKEDEGAGGTGKADDAQEGASEFHRFGIIDKAAGDRGSPKIQQHGDDQRNRQTARQQALNGLQHPLAVAGGVIVADERQGTLGDALPHGKGQQVHLFGDPHPGHGGIGVAGGKMVQHSIADGAHDRDEAAGQPNREYFPGDALPQRVLPGRSGNGGLMADLMQEQSKITGRGQIGKQGGQAGSGYLQLQHKDEQRVQQDIKDTAKRNAKAGLSGIALRPDQMCQHGIERRRHGA